MKKYKTHAKLTLSIGMLTLAGIVVIPGHAQEAFVEYQEPTAGYLERLHGRTGRLAWHSDFPGGFPAWQSAARSKLRELLGLDRIATDCAHHTVTVQLGERVAEEGYIRQLGRIETEPGVQIPFWLLTPTGSVGSPRPWVICAHGHDSNGWNTYAGVYDDEAHQVETLTRDANPGIQAVRRGFVALVPATRGLAKANAVSDANGRHGKRDCRAQLIHCLLAGRTAVGERVWDTQRLIDWAVSELTGIDARRLVMLGNSGGGVLTVHTAALDERIAVAVPSCSVSSFTSETGYVFHCDCCLIPRVQSELGDMADIGGLTAPRALLVVHGRKDGLHSEPDVEAAMKRVESIYRAAHAEDRFAMEWGPDGHKFYPTIMWPFIESQLQAAELTD